MASSPAAKSPTAEPRPRLEPSVALDGHPHLIRVDCVPGSFKDVVKSTSDNLVKAGLKVVSETDLAHALKHHTKIRPCVVLGALSEAITVRAMANDPECAALVMCSVVVREDNNGSINVTFSDPLANTKIDQHPYFLNVAAELHNMVQRACDYLHATIPTYKDVDIYDSVKHVKTKALDLEVLPRLPAEKVVTIRSDATVVQAIKILADNHITSAPVENVNPATPAGTAAAAHSADAAWATRYLGIIDFAGLLFWLVKTSHGKAPETLDELIAVNDSARTATIGQLMSSTGATSIRRWHPFVALPLSKLTFFELLRNLGEYHNVRRLCIVQDGSSGEILRLVTQSTVMRLLCENLPEFKELMGRTLAELRMTVPKPILSMREDNTVYDAFILMVEALISEVPVLRENKLVGFVGMKNISKLLLDQSQVHLRQLKEKIQDCPNYLIKPVTAQSNETLGAVIKRIVDARAHRCYIVSATDNLLAVVTLRDIIWRFFFYLEAQRVNVD